MALDPAVLEDRLERLGRDVEALEREKADVKDVQALAREVAGVKRMLTFLVLALVTSTLTFGIWALQLATAHG